MKPFHNEAKKYRVTRLEETGKLYIRPHTVK